MKVSIRDTSKVVSALGTFVLESEQEIEDFLQEEWMVQADGDGRIRYPLIQEMLKQMKDQINNKLKGG